MAIIPTKDNFEIMPAGPGVRFDGGPKPADVTRNTRVLAQGLMAFDKIRDEHERIDAAADANAFAQFLDKQQAALSERKGINAYRNEDGTFVSDTLKQNIEDELGRMRSGMSASKREKFDMMVLPFQRSFNRSTTKYIQDEHRDYEKATLKNTEAQYGKMAFVNYASDPEVAHQALNDFHGVARYQAVRDGADEALADSIANNKVSGIVKGIIDDAIEKGDLKTAQAYQERYGKIMTADDLIHANNRIHRQENIRIGEDYADRVFSVGATHYGGGDMSVIYGITVQSESDGKRYGRNGKLIESDRGALGEYQVMPETAKNPGFGITPAKDASPEELARVGQEYLDKMLKRYGGDLGRMWGAYNAGPGTVDKLIRQYGDDWLSHAPKETQDYVSKNIAAYQKQRNAPVKMMSVAEFAEKAKEAFGNNKQAYQAAIDSYSHRHRIFVEQDKANQEETLMTVYDMADEGKTMTEIEQSGLLYQLDHKNYRSAVGYIRKNTQYDFELLAELESNPDKLQQTDLRTLRGKLAKSDINRLARKQAIGKTEQGKNVLEKLTFDMRTVLLHSGINLNATKKKDIETRAQLNDYMIKSLESFHAEYKRYPNDKERLDMLKNAVGEIVVPAFFGLWNTNIRRFKATPEQFVDSLSTPERMQILMVADAAGISGTEDEKILAVLRSKGAL